MGCASMIEREIHATKGGPPRLFPQARVPIRCHKRHREPHGAPEAGQAEIEDGDDAAILQQYDSSSELPICCKRGHSAILPSRTHFFPVHAAPRRGHKVALERALVGRGAARCPLKSDDV